MIEWKNDCMKVWLNEKMIGWKKEWMNEKINEWKKKRREDEKMEKCW